MYIQFLKGFLKACLIIIIFFRMCKCHMCVLLDDVTNNRNTLVLIALGGI